MHALVSRARCSHSVTLVLRPNSAERIHFKLDNSCVRMRARALLMVIVTSVLCTHAQVLSPRRVRFKELSPSMLSVTWKEPKGQFDSYMLVYITDPGGLERELSVSKKEPKAVIQGFDPSKEITVRITAVRGTERSKPLMGTYTGSGSEVSEVSVRQDPSHAEDDNQTTEEGDEALATSAFNYSVYGLGSL
ncbi:hypothetical protein E1301_Tti022830 [Triplophysa tibetana]|uniref:Fibronectin type-III domain-containing protein n=1 Tax=Triplophysa tibetana TaxID=1572043 RepID=A0A5A9NJC6_9TELE|nr:hypothetical protein E1301_Tti022830 [Triplophysa tibetana]